MYVQNVSFLESIGHQLYPQQVSVVIVQLLSNLPLTGAIAEDRLIQPLLPLFKYWA
jgi:hypothetical protein